MNIHEAQVERYSNPKLLSEEQLLARLLETFIEIDALVRGLSPCDDGYLGLSIHSSGYDKPCGELRLSVYYDGDYRFDVKSLDELRDELAKCNPEEIKKKRIAELRDELAKLEAEVGEVGA